MALIFPSNPPSLGQDIGYTYAAPNGYTYTWDGTKWYVASSGSGGSGGTPLIVKDEGTVINTATSTLNFTGAGVTATTTGSTVTINVTAEPLNTATTTTLGGVIIGSGINIDSSGTISVREGLQYWTESLTPFDGSTAAVSLIVNNTEANIDAVIKAKGLGALSADDEGGKRGEYAVDWQKIRGTTAEVASGNFSVISGGSFNKASGLHSVVIGGNNNTNDADYAVVLGGVNGNTRGIKGSVIMPGYATNGAGSSSGVIQTGYYILGAETSSSSPIALSTDGNSTVSTSNQITLVDNSAVYFEATILAKELFSETPAISVWKSEGVAKRAVDNTTTNYYYQITPPSANLISSINTTSNWNVIMDIDNATGCILFTVQGESGKTIRWSAKVETIEITDLGM